jgi:hypothetical protein
MWKRNYINIGIHLTKLQVLEVSEFLTVLNSIEIQGNISFVFAHFCCRVDILLLHTLGTQLICMHDTSKWFPLWVLREACFTLLEFFLCLRSFLFIQNSSDVCLNSQMIQ